ncbi:hypothetical protein [Martelella sp. HB161492]|uniref:hypothetical protein n=1 Tax=Martelella sp. HB161492 TaxID=2720726 RepID=UPI0015921924|nr:hypothetical protein [Martelella sp. HB161492]
MDAQRDVSAHHGPVLFFLPVPPNLSFFREMEQAASAKLFSKISNNPPFSVSAARATPARLAPAITSCFPPATLQPAKEIRVEGDKS